MVTNVEIGALYRVRSNRSSLSVTFFLSFEEFLENCYIGLSPTVDMNGSEDALNVVVDGTPVLVLEYLLGQKSHYGSVVNLAKVVIGERVGYVCSRYMYPFSETEEPNDGT